VSMAPPMHRPSDRDELVALLAETSAGRGAGGPLQLRGGGAHSLPDPPAGDVGAGGVLDTTGLHRVVDHTPADLTVTVEAGMRATELDALLGGHGQCWPQADIVPGATVGGILAAGASGGRRLREGPVRDSLLEVVVATGDGRLVTGGGRTVKNVSGFDIPRMMVGSRGTLGVIVQATLKLWPRPERERWFRREGGPAELGPVARALVASAARPAAVVLGPHALDVELVGHAGDVAAPEGFAAGGGPPRPLAASGGTVVRASVPPTALMVLVGALVEEGFDFRASMGVGLCDIAVPDADAAAGVRDHARMLGGHAVVTRAAGGLDIDALGPPPAGLVQMRRLRTAFDPARILNRGLIPWLDDERAVAA
jgi:glycolate oxidase FAD binding subunit